MNDPDFSFEAQAEHQRNRRRFLDTRRRVVSTAEREGGKPPWKVRDAGTPEKPLWIVERRGKDGRPEALRYQGPAAAVYGKFAGRRFRLRVTSACFIGGHEAPVGSELIDADANEAFTLKGHRAEILEEYADSR